MSDYYFKTINSRLNTYRSPYLLSQHSVDKYNNRNKYSYKSQSKSQRKRFSNTFKEKSFDPLVEVRGDLDQ